MFLEGDYTTIANVIGQKGLRHYEDVLSGLNKIVTRKTLDSITYQIRPTESGISIVFIANRKGLFYIESGKKANTKYPMKKVGANFELVPELAEWKSAVGFSGSDFLLARTIAINPREGIPVSEIVGERLRKDLITLALEFAKKSITIQLKTELKKIYSGL